MRPTAVITGASRGIGEAFAQLFATDGYDLVLISRDEQRLQAIKQRLEREKKITVHTLIQDLSAANATKKVMDYIRSKNIPIDVLVNNAGFGNLGRFANSDPKREQELLSLNMIALTELTKAVLPSMIARHAGKILNVASIAAFQPGPLMATYYASKAYVLSFSVALHEELKGTGVSISCLCPGPTRTSFANAAHIEKSRLFTAGLYPVMTAKDVALAGYRSMQKNRAIIVPGLFNKISAFMGRLVPMWLSAKVAMRMHKNIGG